MTYYYYGSPSNVVSTFVAAKHNWDDQAKWPSWLLAARQKQPFEYGAVFDTMENSTQVWYLNTGVTASPIVENHVMVYSRGCILRYDQITFERLFSPV